MPLGDGVASGDHSLSVPPPAASADLHTVAAAANARRGNASGRRKTTTAAVRGRTCRRVVVEAAALSVQPTAARLRRRGSDAPGADITASAKTKASGQRSVRDDSADAGAAVAVGGLVHSEERSEAAGGDGAHRRLVLKTPEAEEERRGVEGSSSSFEGEREGGGRSGRRGGVARERLVAVPFDAVQQRSGEAVA